MSSLTVIILTKNEEKNIEQSIKSAKQITNNIIVVDSGSVDKTIDLAKKNGAKIYFHEWTTHAQQFNWALENCNINTEWVFRLDADERIMPDLADEILEKINNNDKTIDGYEMRWRVYFMNKWIKHGGTHNSYFLRLFRYGTGKAEDKIMDERIFVKGKVEKLKGDLLHYDYKGLDSWLIKHIWYSQLELKLYNNDYLNNENTVIKNNSQHKKRGFYYKLPIFIRSKIYFLFRYYFKLGFLDGKEGKIFFYFQAYWYRFLVDVRIYKEIIENKEKKGN